MSLQLHELIVEGIQINTDEATIKQSFKKLLQSRFNRDQRRVINKGMEEILLDFYMQGFFLGCEEGGKGYMNEIQRKLSEAKENLKKENPKE